MSIFKWLHTLVDANLQRSGIIDLSGHNILLSAVSPTGIFIDLGANKGRFYGGIAKKFGLSGFAIEAEPTLFNHLPQEKSVRTYNYAIGKQNGFVELFLSNESEANSMHKSIASNWGVTGVVSVPAITLEKFIKDEKVTLPIDVLKIDIEGAETDVINTTSAKVLGQVKQIPVEFHDFLIPTVEYKTAMDEALKKLRQNDFLLIRFSPQDHRAMLAVNRRMVKLTFTQTLRIRIIHPCLRTAIFFHTWLWRIFNGVN